VPAGRVRVEDVADAPLTDEQVDRITAVVLADPEQGRLDRILAQHAAEPVPPPANWEGRQPRRCGEHRTVGAHRAWCHDCNGWCYPHDGGLCRGCANDLQGEIGRLRGMVVALEAECALLTDALAASTHAHVPAPGPVDRGCWAAHPDPLLAEQDVLCGLLPDHPVHRTPARVRAELEGA
jgi:hypothetical protein